MNFLKKIGQAVSKIQLNKEPEAEKSAVFYRLEAERHRQAMKKSLKSFGVTVLFTAAALIALMTVTAAWYANNSQVSGNGASINAQTSESLIIGLTAPSVTNIDSVTTDLFHVTQMSRSARLFSATTHDPSPASPLGLQFCTNPDMVDYYSGLAVENEVLKLSPVKTAEKNKFCIDYIVYLGAGGQDLSFETLKATITNPVLTESDLESHFSASIDFYVNDVYKDTLNAAGMNPDNSLTPKTETIDLLDANELLRSTPVKVLMRCYFDGALLKTAGHTYVNSDTIRGDLIDLTVLFTID